jgi:hypothetical protein
MPERRAASDSDTIASVMTQPPQVFRQWQLTVQHGQRLTDTTGHLWPLACLLYLTLQQLPPKFHRRQLWPQFLGVTVQATTV